MNSAFLGSLWAHGGMDRGHSSRSSGDGARADAAKQAADRVDMRLERALLTMEAMWSLLSERLGVTDDELQERIVEIDLTDGVLDGKVRRPAAECPACNRRVPRRFHRCMYCGEDILKDPFA